MMAPDRLKIAFSRTLDASEGYALIGPSWHLAGVGSARYGYAVRSPAGALRWLGKTALESLRHLDR